MHWAGCWLVAAGQGGPRASVWLEGHSISLDALEIFFLVNTVLPLPLSCHLSHSQQGELKKQGATGVLPASPCAGALGPGLLSAWNRSAREAGIAP